MFNPDKEQVREESNNKDRYMILFSLVVLLFSIAYVRLAYRLFDTDVEPTNNSAFWEISYIDVKTIDSSIGAKNISMPVLNNSNIYFDTDFITNGDYLTYKIRVMNKGSLDAVLNSMNVYNSNEDEFDYIFEGIKIGDTLLAGEIKEFDFTIKAKNAKEGSKDNFIIGLNYIQK